LHVREETTIRPGHAAELARAAVAAGLKRIIAVGGDGTLSEVVNGILAPSGQPSQSGVTVGVLAAGTGSDFCRTLGIAARKAAIHALVSSATMTSDAGRITLIGPDGAPYTRYFINAATFGLGGDTALCVSQWRRRGGRFLKGRAMYAAAALRALDRYKNHRVAVGFESGETIGIDSNLIVVSNGRYAGGGMMLAPNARFDDGLFEVILTDGVSRWDIIKELPRIGRGGHLKNPKVIAHRTSAVSVRAERMPVEVDGDFAGYTPAHLEVLPAALHFLVPDA
jgi:YegS/Rv2252/BmrU family lipid kinase